MSWIFNTKREKGFTNIYIGIVQVARISFVKAHDTGWNCSLRTMDVPDEMFLNFGEALTALHEKLNAIAPEGNQVP